MTSALVASDWFIIPVFPSQYDLAGLEELTVTIGKIRKKYNSTLKLAGVLLGNFDKSTKLILKFISYFVISLEKMRFFRLL